MRNQLMDIYKELVKSGYFKAARKILRLMATGSVYITDGDIEAWQSGAANFLLDKCRYANRNYGFEVYVKAS